MTDKTAASIENYCNMYKRPYILYRSTDLHKICGKMPTYLTPFTELKVKVCGPFP